ncbi:MAG: lysylphosphatidylglycerol synthase transmembrane domain-containing protein [Herpetosiphon sp.]
MSVETGGFQLRERFLRPRTLLSFALGLVIIVIAIRATHFNAQQTWQEMRRANPVLYLLAFVMFYATFPVRALRWRVLLRSAKFPVDHGRNSWASLGALTEYLLLSWFANCVVPAKLGDAYRGYLLKHNGNVSFSRSVGTIFAERLLDMTVLFALLVGSGWMMFGARIPAAAQFVFVLGALLVVAIVIGLAAMRYLSPYLRRLVPTRLAPMYQHFEEGTLQSMSPRVLPALLGLTVVIWFGESMRLFFVVAALGALHLPLAAVMFVALTSSLLTTVPATPGGLGLVEGGLAGVLQSPLFAVGAGLAGAVVILDRLVNYWSVVLAGLVVYVFSKRK